MEVEGEIVGSLEVYYVGEQVSSNIFHHQRENLGRIIEQGIVEEALHKNRQMFRS